MPFPFDVGNPTMQDLLDWVALPAQPPPPQGRDTHALRFILRKNDAARYSGLMFFRPQGAGGGGVGSLPGLNGTGDLVANTVVCQEISGVGSPAAHAKVNIMFRRRPTLPALVFATITFFVRLLPDSLDQGTEAVDTSNCSMNQFGAIDIDPPQWQLRLEKTTVLLRSP
jgi:hypothetical protein